MVACPPRSNDSVNAFAFGSKAISRSLTMGRPSISTGPTRNDEPKAVAARPYGASGRMRQ
jgi:hypothetical protein